MSGTDGLVLGTVLVTGVRNYSTTVAFQRARRQHSLSDPQQVKKSFNDADKLYGWNLENPCKFPRPLQYDGMLKARPFIIEASRLKQRVSAPSAVPKQSLKSTAMFFIRRLRYWERKQLGRTASLLSDTTLRLGTTCSGMDGAVTVLEQTIAAINQTCGTNIKLRHVFSCECDPTRQSYILQAFSHKMDHLFADVNVFKESHGECLRSKKLVPIPAIDILISGTSCKNVSQDEYIHTYTFVFVCILSVAASAAAAAAASMFCINRNTRIAMHIQRATKMVRGAVALPTKWDSNASPRLAWPKQIVALRIYTKHVYT